MVIILTLSGCEKGEVPSIVTKPLRAIGTTTVICGGKIISDGGSKVSGAGVCWSESYYLPSINDLSTRDGTGMIDFESKLTTLFPGKNYYIRAYATNKTGTGYGEIFTFRTFGENPTAVTEPATNILQNSATLNGIVNAGYLQTRVFFDYGTTTKYGNTLTIPGYYVYSNVDMPVSANIDGLVPNTSYHFRVIAGNAIGGCFGNDLTFTTSGI